MKPTFSRLLKGVPLEHIPAATLDKMKLLSLTDYFNVLPRNLTALLGSVASQQQTMFSPGGT
jgi:hypothetical protein